MNLDLLTANDIPAEHPSSYYAATATVGNRRPVLNGSKRADICIVGGGYTGLSAAIHLAQKGRSVILLDANRVGWGASGRNGGQVGSGQRADQDALETSHGLDTATHLWRLAEEAKFTLKSLIREYSINCEYKNGIIHADHKARYVSHSQAYVEKLNRQYDYDKISFLDKAEVQEQVGSLNYHGGTLDQGAGHLHPLKYALGLANAAEGLGVEICENSRVTDIQGGKYVVVKTANGQVEANHCLVACNGYLGDLGNQVMSPMQKLVMPINNFILVTAPLNNAELSSLIKNDVAVADSRFVVNYFRMVHDEAGTRLLFGGGENYGYRFPNDIKAFVRKPMLAVYPQLQNTQIDFGWGGTLGITMSRMPVFQRLSNQIYSVGGYSGHGVPIATLGGKIMAEAILGDTSKFDVFNKLPKQHFPGGSLMRWPLLVLAMTYYAMRDRL